MKQAIILLTAALLVPLDALHAQPPAPARPVKKLIQYGWGVPYPDQVRSGIRAMEQKPFDGIIFRLRDWDHAFDPRPWDEAQLQPQLDDLAAIEWGTFTDNFLCLYAANHWQMDWFNDQQWACITANLRLSAKAARIGRCVGLVFDPEPYGDNPWAYSSENQDRSFAAVEAQVQQRGAQFMAALQAELPNVRLLTFFHQSLFGHLLDNPDPQDRQQRLSQDQWALLSAFWNGVLEAANPEARIIDGNELAYYMTNREQFFRSYHTIRQRSLSLVPEGLRTKHAVNVQAGNAVYMDQVLDLRQPPEQFVSHYLTPAQRLRFFEHNVYYALTTSDEYVWCYSERLNWWEDQVPDGAEAAIRAAREAIVQGRTDYGDRLSTELAEFLAVGRQQMSERAKDQ